MSYEEAGLVLSSLFGVYVVGWCAGFILLTIKQAVDKI